MNQQKQNIGKIHIYTGNGKGKTTAAIGICMRAIGAGKTVLWTQFVKGQEYSEIKLFNQLYPALIFKNFGRSCFINRAPEQTDIDAAKKGLNFLQELWNSNEKYDVVVLDEFNIALHYHLITENDALNIITKKPQATELIITGRYAPNALINIADLVTEMQEIKHYYNTEKLTSRKGIEC